LPNIQKLIQKKKLDKMISDEGIEKFDETTSEKEDEIVAMLDVGTDPMESDNFLADKKMEETEETPEPENYPKHFRGRKLRIKRMIKRIIRKAPREELFSIIDRLFSEVSFDDQETLQKLDYMRSKALKKFIIRFITKHFEALDKKDFFADLDD